jgi:deoxyribodipyrimidine photo-lyase
VSTAIWWIRRDLRLMDNQALTSAMMQADAVVPLFILDRKLLDSPRSSPERNAFLMEGLQSLDADLSKQGSYLVVREGEPSEVLRELCYETQSEWIFAQADVSPYARRRDEHVGRELPLKLTPGLTIHLPDSVLKSDGSAYTVYTPFSRQWRNQPHPGKPLPAPEKLTLPPSLESKIIPTLPLVNFQGSFKAGESEAQNRIETFISSRIFHYDFQRDRLDKDGSSCLSPYLRFGMISARQAYWMAYEAGATGRDRGGYNGVEAWINELIWREFYASILYYFPAVAQTAFQPKYRKLHWREDPAGFNAWTEGRTGYPIVDAAMRQLNSTGWMHNRARMITASFLVKDLLINWRLGEAYFMRHLLDGDPAANNGGWQWVAGTGTDAAPYFRIFNPILQAKKFDPHGNYVRRWLPELVEVPEMYIHSPWMMPESIQSQVRCRIGIDYPSPIVEHAMARQRAIDVYRRK